MPGKLVSINLDIVRILSVLLSLLLTVRSIRTGNYNICQRCGFINNFIVQFDFPDRVKALCIPILIYSYASSSINEEWADYLKRC